MKRYVTTGSAIERAWNCRASVALPHATFVSPDSNRGSVFHAYLEDIPTVGIEKALAAVDDEWRDACAALELEGLEYLLASPGAAEIAFAYNCETGTVRELGRGRGRIYETVEPNEIPCTLDVVLVAEQGKKRIGLVADYKSGWSMRGKKADANWQLDFGALVAARAFNLDEVHVQLVHVSPGVKPWVERGVRRRIDLELIEEDVRSLYASALELRREAEAGRLPTEYRMGPWCEYCPCKRFCPAQVALLRSVIIGGELDELLRFSPIPDDVLADAYNRLPAIKKGIAMLEGIIIGQAQERAIYLGPSPDGQHRWLAPVIKEGNEALDGDVVFDAIAEGLTVVDEKTKKEVVLIPAELAEGVATAATKVVATKKDLEAAVRAVAPPRQGARAVNAILEKVRAAGGARRPLGLKVLEIKTKDAAAPERPQLPDNVETNDD